MVGFLCLVGAHQYQVEEVHVLEIQHGCRHRYWASCRFLFLGHRQAERYQAQTHELLRFNCQSMGSGGGRGIGDPPAFFHQALD